MFWHEGIKDSVTTLFKVLHFVLGSELDLLIEMGLMDPPAQQSPSSPPQIPLPLAFLPLSIGATPGMSFSESSRLAAQNAGAWMMILFGGLFVIMNALQGSVEFVGINLAFVSAGATSLWLAGAGFRRTAMTLLSAGSCLVFFFAAITFRSGMENYLLITMGASILLLDRPATRIGLAGLNAAAFLYVKLSLPHDGAELIPNSRYILNIGLFVLALAGMIEFFRVLNSDYLRTLEKANSDLATSNHAKEKLFSVIAHDLRGPVGNLKVSLEMLESGTLAPEEFGSLVHDLAFDVDKSYSCLENLLSWSATQLGGMTATPVDLSLREEVEDIVRLSGFAFAAKNLKFANSVPEECILLVDRQHLHGILRNLLSNAVKFTPQGGQVEVSAKRTAEAWTITVSDTGVGMPSEKMKTLFSKHDIASTPGTAAEKGLGLGIEICKQFVALNGGTISGESSLGGGTKISVTLPAGKDSDKEAE